MAHALYTFNFVKTVNEQLVEALNGLKVSPLNAHSLGVLSNDQQVFKAAQGVYVLFLGNELVYVGKADKLSLRLKKHLNKLSGRLNLVQNDIGYKALILDASMGTAANETLLIQGFKKLGLARWNNQGFGPNDPGRNRDGTEPGEFDGAHPIEANWQVEDIEDVSTIGGVLAKMKKKLPFVFRYKVDAKSAALPIDLTGKPRMAQSLLHEIVKVLGSGWKGVVLSYGMVLYKTNKTYEYGITLTWP